MNREVAKELTFLAGVRITNYYDNSKYEGWVLDYIQAEKPIPQSWRLDFYKEISSDNEEYRKNLEENLRWFGVRWG